MTALELAFRVVIGWAVLDLIVVMLMQRLPGHRR